MTNLIWLFFIEFVEQYGFVKDFFFFLDQFLTACVASFFLLLLTRTK